MSRRKHPYLTDQQNGHTKFVKRQANRAIRQMDDAPANGKQYRSSFSPENKKAYRK